MHRQLSRLIRVAVGLSCAFLAARPAAAQRNTVLAVTGLPLQVTTTTANDFDANAVILGTFAFTVNLTSNSPSFTPRQTTVQVRCESPCPNTGTLQETSLQWRRIDLGTWNTLTTGYSTIEVRDAVYNGTNDPWGNSVQWRYNISWTGTPPTALTRWRIRLRLQVAAP